MRRLCLHIIIYILSTACFGRAFATGSDALWRNITLRDGLAGLTVTDFAQDPTGMMWIATSNGITLFNGMSLFNYPLPRNDEGNPNYTYQLALDQKGNVYAATRSGVYKLDRYERNFKRVVPEINSAETVLPDGNTLYVGNGDGLYVVDNDRKVRKYRSPYRYMDTDFSVRCIRKDGGGRIWFITKDAINWIDKKDGGIKYKMLNIPTGMNRFSIYQNKLFIGTKNYGLYVYNTTSQKLSKIDGVGTVISDVETTANGSIAVASNGVGAFLIDGNSGTIAAHYGSDESGERFIPDNAVYAFGVDRLGHKWLGFLNTGLLYTYDSSNIVRRFKAEGFDSKDINVISVYNSGKEKIVTTNGGFYYIDASGRAEYKDTRRFDMQIVNCAGRLGDTYYIGSYDNGLVTFNPSSGAVQRMASEPKLSYASITDIEADPAGNLWIAGSEGLFCIKKNGGVRNYNEFNSKLFSGANNLQFDNTGMGWIGTSRGLCLYLPASDAISSSDFPNGFWNKYQNLKLSRGHGSQIFAYYQTNLFFSDYQMGKFGKLTIPDGILGELCSYFVDDMHGHYFVLTEKGLFMLNYQLDSYRHFGRDAGLDCDKINRVSIDGMGKLWICTDNGLFFIDALSVDRQKTSDAILPNAVLVGGRPLQPSDLLGVSDGRRLSVGWNFGSAEVSFSPVSNRFANSEGTVFNYQVDGGKWMFVNNNQAIVLRGLSLGTHYLRLRMPGSKGITTYRLTVSPDGASWAELLLLVVAVALFFWWRRYHKRTSQLLEEHHETELALISEAEEMKAEAQEEAELAGTAERTKYAKSGVSMDELADVARKMDKLMAEQKPYLNKELKMSEVATAVGTTPSLLSQVFTLYIKENYYDYVNKLRLEEFKRLVGEGALKHYTITAVSEQCGFRKTAFFSTFRKVEGMTPTEYIRNKSKNS